MATFDWIKHSVMVSSASTFVSHVLSQLKFADLAPESSQKASPETWGCFVTLVRLTCVSNVHPDSQLSGLKLDDRHRNQRV